MKLGIGLPLTTDREYSQFWDSFMVMAKPDFVYIRAKFPAPIDVVRNEIVLNAREENVTHLLMMDTDQVYPQETCLTLLKTLEICESYVAGTIVYRRYPPFDPLVFTYDGKGYLKPTDEEIYKHEYLRVDSTGCGCILYNMEIFEVIKQPWFEDKSRQLEFSEEDTEHLEGEFGAGEDFDFCKKLGKEGYEIWINTTLDIIHMSLLGIDRKFSNFYNKLVDLRKKGRIKQ
jgi:hypothetical protein